MQTAKIFFETFETVTHVGMTFELIALLGRNEWSAVDMSKANRLLIISKRAYDLVREIFIDLPHPTTVYKKFSWFKLSVGYILQSFDYLNEKAKLDTWTPAHYLTSFCFDETKVANVGMLDVKLEQIIGPHAEAFLIMFRSLNNSWQLPIYINFDVQSKQVENVKSQLTCIYEETVIEIEKRNFKVLITVCDQVQCLKTAQKVSF